MAQGVAPPAPSIPLQRPALQGAVPPRLELNAANKAYADCTNAKRSEVLLYSAARQLREVLDHRERYIYLLQQDPKLAQQYPGGVDQMIAEGYRRYREAGGTGSTPQAVQPGEPPCAPAVQFPPGRGPAGTPPAVAQAEREHEACVYRNLARYRLYQASESVVAGVNRRDELKKTGERLEWKLATRENVQQAERDLAARWERYRSLGGAAARAEDVVRTENPCKEALAKVDAARREAYSSGNSSSVTRSAVRIAPPGGTLAPYAPR
jgi:hypothetical protein